MATLTSLTIYPIKSCAGIALRQARLMETGLVADLASGEIGDREWMLVDSSGQFLTQRELPMMATLRPRLVEDGFEIDAPGMPALKIGNAIPNRAAADRTLESNETVGGYALGNSAAARAVTIWNDSLLASDCGDIAAQWFSAVLSTDCRLVRFDRSRARLADASWSDGRQVPTLFSDGFPILIISEASLEDLNQRLRATQRATLPMERFRPNLVIGGTDAFEEDFAASLEFGTAVLKPTKPCPRCAIPSIDQRSGAIGPDPLDILQSYRASARIGGAIAFGMNAVVSAGVGSVLTVGQEVNIELAF